MSLTKQQLQEMFVSEEERPFSSGVTMFIEQVTRAVKNAAQLGKTRVSDIALMTTEEVMINMTLRRLRDRFPDSDIGYTDGPVKRFYIDWS